MTIQLEGEICILGGGPAGSAIARRLAELGHETLLVQRAPAAIRPRAESLAPSIFPILDFLELRRLVDAATFCRDQRALLVWQSNVIEEKNFNAERPALIERSLFDSLLRKAASCVGVQIIACASASSPNRVGPGDWRVPLTTANGPVSVRAKFLIDARGRRRRTIPDDSAQRTAALSASWAIPNKSFSETRIEAGVDGWFWGSPLPDRCYATTLFIDSAHVAGLDRDSRTELYRERLSRTILLKDLLDSKPIQPICVRDATAGIAHDLIGVDFIRVGEAALSIDPLSSQGIQTAFISAIQGSAAVHTILTPSCDPGPAIEFYRERQQTAASHASHNAARTYAVRLGAESHPFWIRRSKSTKNARYAEQQEIRTDFPLPYRISVSRELAIVKVPVLSGNLITRTLALSHPSLPNPIAYFGDTALVPLFDQLPNQLTTDQILQQWTSRISPETAWGIMNWMYAVGLFVSQVASNVRHASTLDVGSFTNALDKPFAA